MRSMGLGVLRDRFTVGPRYTEEAVRSGRLLLGMVDTRLGTRTPTGISSHPPSQTCLEPVLMTLQARVRTFRGAVLSTLLFPMSSSDLRESIRTRSERLQSVLQVTFLSGSL